MPNRNRHRIAVAAIGATLATALAACSTPAVTDPDGPVTLTLLVPNDATSLSLAEAQAAAFHALNEDITVEVSSWNVNDSATVPAKLATGEMEDMFVYNPGLSEVASLNGGNSLLDISGETFFDVLPESYTQAVSDEDGTYAVPTSTASPYGVFYNKSVFEDLGLEVPHTWDEFFEVAAAVKAEGIIPVVQTYGTTFTSQILYAGAFAGQMLEDSTWVDRFADGGKASYGEGVVFMGIEALERLHSEELVNADFQTAVNTDGFAYLANGEAAMYPYLGSLVPGLAEAFPDAVDEIGYFPVPDDNPEVDPMTIGLGYSLYVNREVENDSAKLAAALEFVEFVVSSAGCDVIAAQRLTGPFLQDGCTLPEDVPPAITDELSFYDEYTQSTLGTHVEAGPDNAAGILVEVGSGFITAEEGAQKLDDDTRAAAQQAGLEGW